MEVFLWAFVGGVSGQPALASRLPSRLATTVERLRAAQSALREVITLADEAPAITEVELRDRLRVLAESAR
ncbi:MAG TPA: hypothetical protein VGL88_15585 [Pseudonocardiaceae bacterium]